MNLKNSWWLKRILKSKIYLFGLGFVLLLGVLLTYSTVTKLTFKQTILAAYSCLSPNQEVSRTSQQMCYYVCQNYGGYVRQDFKALKCCCKGGGISPTTSRFTPYPTTAGLSPTTYNLSPTAYFPSPTIKPTSIQSGCYFNNVSCTNNQTLSSFNGYCYCKDKTTTGSSTRTSIYSSPTPAPTITAQKRCVEANYWPIVNHPARVEEYRNGRWVIVENCLYPKYKCDPVLLQCTANINRGAKAIGASCSNDSECLSGECASRYTSPWGEDVYLFNKQCVYSINEQQVYTQKKASRDEQTTNALLAAAVLSSPLLADTYGLAVKYGIPVAANYLSLQLQNPEVQSSISTLNFAATLYALTDCAKTSGYGDWCSTLVAVVSLNPTQFGQALSEDFNTISQKVASLPKSQINQTLNLVKQLEEATTVKPGISEMVTEIDDVSDVARTVLPYKPSVSVSNSLSNWPVGQRFASNRGNSYVVVDKLIGQGGFGDVYRATLYEPGGSRVPVVIKFPQELTRAEITSLASEQYILAKANNAVSNKNVVAAPYGFAKVKTSLGEIELPLTKEFPTGNTLSHIVNENSGAIYLKKKSVDALYKAARELDAAKIYLRDIFGNNVWVTDEGSIIIYDPFVPRFDLGNNESLSLTMRSYSNEAVSELSLDTSVMSWNFTKQRWEYSVPKSNVEALDKMFKLYGRRLFTR